MPFLLPKSVFIHVPKTGGTWVVKALTAAGIPVNVVTSYARYDKRLHSDPDPHVSRSRVTYDLKHGGLDAVHANGKFTFAFVRHPMSFYASFWSYKTACGWDDQHDLDRLARGSTFAEFIQLAIDNRPTLFTRICRHYYGERYDALDFIGKQEHLSDDLITALHLAGEEFDEEAIRSVAPLNTYGITPEWQQKCVLPQSLYAELMTVESDALEAFGYTKDEATIVTQIA